MKSGKVTIGFPSVVGTLYLPQPLSDFCKKYPEIELKTLEKGGSALRKEVENGITDKGEGKRICTSETNTNGLLML